MNVQSYREFHEARRLKKIYDGLKAPESRPKYAFNNLSRHEIEFGLSGKRKTKAIFPPLGSIRTKNGIIIPGLKTLYRPIMGASPATFFVKQSDGDDSKDGLSDANAWKTIAKVNAQSFSGADVCQFKRAETWIGESLIVPSNGSAGLYITFSDYGTGALPFIDGTHTQTGWSKTGDEWSSSVADADTPQAVWEDGTFLDEGIEGSLAVGEYKHNAGTDLLWVRLSGDDDPVGHTMVWCELETSIDVGDKDYIIIENLKLSVPTIESPTGVNSTTQGGIRVGTGATNFTARNCTLIGALNGKCTALMCQSGSPVSITGNDVSLVNIGIWIRGSAGITGLVDDNTVYTMDKGDDENADCVLVYPIYDYSGLTLSNNDLSDFPDHGIDCNGENVIVEGNYIHDPHSTAVAAMGGMKIWAGGVIVRYNLIKDIVVGSLGTGMHIQRGTDTQVYYNIIDTVEKYGMILQSVGGVDLIDALIYHNAVCNCADLGITVNAPGGGNVTATIKNNILDGANADLKLNTADGNAVIAGGYNCLVNDAAVTIVGGDTYTGAANDLGSTDPLFVDAGNGDFTLQSASPCINAGIDVGLDRDYNGIPIPQGSAPDIGALEFEEDQTFTGGVSLVVGEIAPSLAGGNEEILNFWSEYFRNVMGFSEALARMRALEMLGSETQDM